MNDPAQPNADEPDACGPAQSHRVEVGRDLTVDGEGNRLDFSQTIIDQSHAYISQTHIVQVAVDEVKNQSLNPRSPYLGLRKFEVRDHHLFFGRDRSIAILQERLQEHFLLVLGASGSGKSSLIRAGLIAKLAEQRGSGFRELIFTPDRNPFESCRASLSQAGYRQSETEFLLTGHPGGLLQAAQTLKQDDEEWLIFIDQFEEIFTLCSQGAIRQHFIEGLVLLGQSEVPGVDLVIAMRADFLDRLSAFPQLAGILQRSELITDLGDDELRLAIQQPAARHGVVFESGLVNEIIQDLKGRNETGETERISLPLLQYTLKLLWDSSDDLSDRILRTSQYRQLGGVRGALQRRVDEIFKAFSPDEQQVAKQIFLHLVDTTTAEAGTTTVGKAVSRRATLNEFSGADKQKVLTQLIDASLLVSDRPTLNSDAVVELAHETLIDSWDTLKGWIEESKPLIRLNNQLTDDASRWYQIYQQNPAEAEAELWQGSKLQWLMAKQQELCDRFGDFKPEAAAFISACKAQADQARRREIRRLRRTIVGISAALVAVSGLGLVSLQQWLRAEQGQTRALVEAADAKFIINRETLDSLLLAVEAGYHLQRLPAFLRPADLQADVMTALAQGVYWVREKKRLESHGKFVEAVAFSPDGRTLATASHDQTVKIWPVEDSRPILELPHDERVLDVAFNADGRLMASADADGIIKLWSTQGETWQEQPSNAYRHSDTFVHSVRFDPQGEFLASASQDGTVKLWNLTNQQPPLTIPAHDQPIREIALSPTGQTIATASSDSTIKLWDRQGELRREPLTGHQGRVMTVQFSPETNPGWLVSGDDQGNVRLWTDRGDFQISLSAASTSGVRQVTFDRQGNRIAAARDDGSVDLWTLDGLLIATFRGHSNLVNGLSFSADDTTLASVSNDQHLIFWDVNASSRLIVLPSPTSSPIFDVAFNPQQFQLAASQEDGNVFIWDLSHAELPRAQNINISSGESWVSELRFNTAGSQLAMGYSDGSIGLLTHPDNILTIIKNVHVQGDLTGTRGVGFNVQGDRLVSGGLDNLVRVWTEQGDPLFSLSGHQNYVSSVLFTSDGEHIISGSNDGTAKIWNVEERSLIHSLEGHTGPIWDVDINPQDDLIATASSDDQVRLWDFQGQKQGILEGHTDAVNTVQFSADGQSIYSGASDSTIKVWSRDGTLLMTLAGHQDAVNSLSLRDNWLASAGHDGKIILWNQSQDFHTLSGLMNMGCNWISDYLHGQSDESINFPAQCIKK